MAQTGARGIAVGRDGWLFWIGRKNELVDLYTDSAATRRLLRRWVRLVEARIRRAKALGATYVHAIVPEKIAVHADTLDRPFPNLDDPPGTRLGRLLAETQAERVDLYEPLRAARAEGPVYLHTDTHWNHRGYIAAYRALCAALGIAPAAHVVAATGHIERFVFDLGGKLKPPMDEAYFAHDFPRHAQRSEANALVQLRETGRVAGRGGFFVGSRAVMRNPEAADPRRIVLFGDSYVFDQGPRLTAMLAESFAEVHAIWSAEIDWKYVAAVKPDLVVYEIAERFLRRVPTDRFSVDAFAESRVRRELKPNLVDRLRRLLRLR
ncbi:alginate O-acetyltransferase AlgX-related protein [Methylobacterium pseudosasicola]|uniref:SGNH hydrolase-like domain-containing protein, acetyltransferase AlgX n=1 Tax=Methylobacterium pseudosasicola TaxID=582667 RepID=A0A1I4J032_9HYPH|nr:hypothetical protein [Methylobacterium pseudosasicola]SFL60018.1 SGNH hydrolase-like domain-containing protein, acetyltransferase AlgX [Methylobacterium pseudosasicola]